MPERFKVSVDLYVMAHDARLARDHVAMHLPAIEDMLNGGFVTGDDVARLQSEDLGKPVTDEELAAARAWQPDNTYFVGWPGRSVAHTMQKHWNGR